MRFHLFDQRAFLLLAGKPASTSKQQWHLRGASQSGSRCPLMGLWAGQCAKWKRGKHVEQCKLSTNMLEMILGIVWHGIAPYAAIQHSLCF